MRFNLKMEVSIRYQQKPFDVVTGRSMLLSRSAFGLLLTITCWSLATSVDTGSGDAAGTFSPVGQTHLATNESQMPNLRAELSTQVTTTTTTTIGLSGGITQTERSSLTSHSNYLSAIHGSESVPFTDDNSSTQMIVAFGSSSTAVLSTAEVDTSNQSSDLFSITLNYTIPTVMGTTTSSSSVLNLSSPSTTFFPNSSYTTPFNTTPSIVTMWTTNRTPSVKTKVEEDKKFSYYSYKIVNNDETAFKHYWKKEEEIIGARQHKVLENQYLTAVTVKLNFTFFFYGHEVDSVTLATGGFLYMSDFLHDRLTYSQYIAPLMAYFGTECLNHSHIHYIGNGTSFTVWWENVTLKDNPSAGQFSFQVTLYSTGHVVFAYNFLPMVINGISSKYHFVRVGLADAYYFDEVTSAGYTERKISEYSRVLVETTAIQNHSLVLIEPLPTCIQQKTCSACLVAATTLPFPCQWCPQLKRCSDGYDRKRQQWLNYGCNMERVTGLRGCSRNRVQLGFVTLLIIVAVTLFVTGFWLCYAHSHPNSSSGRWLIEHRPRACFEAVRKMSCCRSPLRRERYVSYQSGLESLA